jgi:2-Cys peroxiredoxin 5
VSSYPLEPLAERATSPQVLDHPGPMGVLGNPRSKRFAMVLDDGVIKAFHVSEAADDPAGDDRPESSCVDAMLATL